MVVALLIPRIVAQLSRCTAGHFLAQTRGAGSSEASFGWTTHSLRYHSDMCPVWIPPSHSWCRLSSRVAAVAGMSYCWKHPSTAFPISLIRSPGHMDSFIHQSFHHHSVLQHCLAWDTVLFFGSACRSTFAFEGRCSSRSGTRSTYPSRANSSGSRHTCWPGISSTRCAGNVGAFFWVVQLKVGLFIRRDHNCYSDPSPAVYCTICKTYTMAYSSDQTPNSQSKCYSSASSCCRFSHPSDLESSNTGS